MSRVPALTVKPGAAAVLITDSAGGSDEPLYVISRDPAAGRVYLGPDPTVSPLNGGVPLEAGTSLSWTTPGQLWVVADPANTAGVALIVTDTIADWQPSPAAIAAQVAAQLLANGVPNVLTQAPIYNATLAAGTSKSFDISEYASVTISTWTSAADVSMSLQQFDQAGYRLWREDFNKSGGDGPIAFAVVGVTLTIKNNGTAGLGLSINGSNRPSARLDVRNYANAGDDWTVTANLTGGGTTTTLTRRLTADFVTNPQLQGGAWASFTIIPATPLGRFELVYDNGNGVAFLCDTAEMITASSGGILVKDKMIALPASPYVVRFRSNSATAGVTLGAHFIPATV